jgi:hypothetical protein
MAMQLASKYLFRAISLHHDLKIFTSPKLVNQQTNKRDQIRKTKETKKNNDGILLTKALKNIRIHSPL